MNVTAMAVAPATRGQHRRCQRSTFAGTARTSATSGAVRSRHGCRAGRQARRRWPADACQCPTGHAACTRQRAEPGYTRAVLQRPPCLRARLVRPRSPPSAAGRARRASGQARPARASWPRTRQGGRGAGTSGASSCAVGAPTRSRCAASYWMPPNTRRIRHNQNRSVPAGTGPNGATTAHSASVRLVTYGMSSRASCARAAGGHKGGLSEASNTCETHETLCRSTCHTRVTPSLHQTQEL